MLYDELATKCPELFKVVDKKIAEKDQEISELNEKNTALQLQIDDMQIALAEMMGV